MDNQNAIRMLSETFNNDFDLDKFIRFVKELLNEVPIRPRDCTQYIAREYNDYISEVVKLGDYNDQKKSIIEILAVKLKKTSSIDRARTMQRNFIANWLSKFDKNAALVAFYGDEEDWRFSFVKMEYNLVKDETGRSKVSKELTPARRYSFLVGKNEPNHTCKRQFVGLLTEDNVNPSLIEIESAFSIERVTKEFFEKYKELFIELEESLQNMINSNKYLKMEFQEKSISTVDFAKKLMGQIVFLYFLQKKGWLGVQKDSKGRFMQWGTGPKNFMRKMFNQEIVKYSNFFNDVLEPLFYEALATERDDDYYRHFDCKIPFLNGGLFEPINDYNWRETDILLDNAIFKHIFDTFDQFNFTVKEDEPLEKEVAVDPEMLGKVFENLLEIKDRKSKGAFYTPREIVHYMCQQSLINYLETNTSITRDDIERFIYLGDFALAQIIREQEQIKKLGKSDIKDKYNIPKSIKNNHHLIDKLLKEIKIVDPACGSGAFLLGMMNEIIKSRSILSVYFREERKVYDLKREAIESCLYGVDIEPSAIEITKLRFWLSLIVDELDMQNIKPLPNLDNKIMCGNSLMEEFEGVKLFDERLLGEVKKDYSREIKQIDDKIALLYKEKGDTIRGKKNGLSVKNIEKEIKKLERKKEDIRSKPKENGRNLTLGEISEKKIKESRKKLSELEKLQKMYFNEQNRKLKKQLKEDIDRIEWELIEATLKEQGNEQAMKKLKQYKSNKAKPFFLWKLYFVEVFQRQNSGFDIVIGNPPYVRVQSIEESAKIQYVSKFVSARGKFDLYILFTELGINVLRADGSLSFIMPNKFTNTNYGIEIRKFVLSETTIQLYIDFSDKGVFEGQTNYPCIILLRKSPSSNNFIHYNHVKRISQTLANSLNLAKREKEFVNEDIDSFQISQRELSEGNWTFVKTEVSAMLKKLSSLKYCSLADHRDKIYEGLITGNNKVYFVNRETIKKYNLEKELIKKLPKGKNIQKYFIVWDDYYVIYPYIQENGNTKLVDICKYPNTKRYFDIHKSVLENRDYLITAGKRWYEIWNPRTIDVFATTKIITPNLSKSNRFALDYTSNNNSFLCVDHDCYAIILKQKNLENYKLFTAILNSPVVAFVIKNISPMFSGGFYKYHTQYLDKIPIPKQFPNPEKIVTLVNRILSITKDNDYLDNPGKQSNVKNLEKEIDQLVYKLYELTPEEIKIIEDFCGKDD